MEIKGEERPPGFRRVPFNLKHQSYSHSSLFNGMWQKDLQEIDQQRFQTEEPTTLYMQYAVSVLSLTANLENSRRYKHYAVTDLSV